MVRLLVTGSREWTEYWTMRRELWRALQQMPGATLVHGACRGADLMAHGIWNEWNLPTEAHPADWALGKAAGMVRNRAMVDGGADLCLAFLLPGSVGTVRCAAMAKNAGIPVERIYPEAPFTEQEIRAAEVELYRARKIRKVPDRRAAIALLRTRKESRE